MAEEGDQCRLDEVLREVKTMKDVEDYIGFVLAGAERVKAQAEMAGNIIRYLAADGVIREFESLQKAIERGKKGRDVAYG